MEAARAYRDSKEVHDSIMRVKYYEDLAKLKTQREVEKLEIQSKKLELEAEKSRVRILMLRGGFVLVLLLCAGLGIVAYAVIVRDTIKDRKRESGGGGSPEICVLGKHES